MSVRGRGDEGSATVLVLVLAAVLVVVATAAATGGSVLVAQRRAAGAADLAALAGAAALHPLTVASGSPAACGEAARISDANGARLTSCAVNGLEVTVEVAVDGAAPVAGPWTVRSSARAGPSSPGEG